MTEHKETCCKLAVPRHERCATGLWSRLWRWGAEPHRNLFGILSVRFPRLRCFSPWQ